MDLLRRFILLGLAAVLGICLAIAFWPRAPHPAAGGTAATRPARPWLSTAATPILPPPRIAPAKPPLAPPVGGCGQPDALRAAAADNAASLAGRQWAPWGRPETGWEIYLPLVASEIGSACRPDSPGFAQALAQWQLAHAQPNDGVLTPASFEVMRVMWLRRRPFVQAFSKGVCPPAADPAALVWAGKGEFYSGKPIQLAPGALSAYRAMLAAARSEVADVAANPQLLTVFSGYRAPADDEARCDKDGGCGKITRVRCSAHRTGTAVDLYLGAAPGSDPASASDPNRLYQSRSAAYLWLVANADRFGFVPYPFEPWHWEWAGQS